MSKNWTFKSFEIEKKTWGEHAGKYVGKISFHEEKTQESFTVNISPEIQATIMTVISGAVAAQASALADQMVAMSKTITGQPTE